MRVASLRPFRRGGCRKNRVPKNTCSGNGAASCGMAILAVTCCLPPFIGWWVKLFRLFEKKVRNLFSPATSFTVTVSRLVGSAVMWLLLAACLPFIGPGGKVFRAFCKICFFIFAGLDKKHGVCHSSCAACAVAKWRTGGYFAPCTGRVHALHTVPIFIVV